MTSWHASVTFETGDAKRHRFMYDRFTVQASSVEAAGGKAARIAMSNWRAHHPRKGVRSMKVMVEKHEGR